uniref:PAC domain-containing protein n=1 Tax=Arcella intermedia TaxID=1963864 RepID=A0A6B2LMF5_9EUKA
MREGRSVSVQLLNYRKNGFPFWNVFVIFPVHDAKGKVPAFIAIQQDITEIRMSQPLYKWLSVHTSLWLEHIGKNIYSHLFIHKKIDGKKLVALTIDQLLSLGTSKEDAHYLFEQIQILMERDLKTRPFKHLSTSAASMKSWKGGYNVPRISSSRSAGDCL